MYRNVDDSNLNIDDYPHEKETVKNLPFNDDSVYAYCGEDRVEHNVDNSRNPIVVHGCSYAYGHGLTKEKSFPSMLSKITNRSIYNFASCGGELRISLSNINPDNEQKKIKDADYVIYIYMHDHINRYLSLQTLYFDYEFLFDTKQNEVHKFLIEKSALYRLVCSGYQLKKILRNYPQTDEIEQYLKLVIKAGYQKVKLYSPNAKFIIILYEEKIPDSRSKFTISYLYKFINSEIWKELERETNGDIQVVRTKDIMGFYFDKNYKLEQDIADWHPNARVWKEFTPKFASKYIK